VTPEEEKIFNDAVLALVAEVDQTVFGEISLSLIIQAGRVIRIDMTKRTTRLVQPPK